MNISEILDTIDDMLDKSWGLPLSGGKCVVDVERLRDLIGDVRLNMPVEINGEKNLLDLIRKTGIELPTFCYYSELSVYGACRMCMGDGHG